MNYFIKLIFGIILLPTLALSYSSPEIQREKSANYQVDLNYLELNNVQHFYEMMTPDGKSLDAEFNGDSIISTHKNIEKIDLKNKTQSKKAKSYFKLYTRVTFIVKDSIHKFSKHSACNKSQNQKIARAAARRIRLKKEAPCSFSQRGGLFIPRQKIDISFTDEDDLLTQLPKASVQGQKISPLKAKIQEHYDFGRVFFFRAGYFSMVVTNYSQIDENKTLIDIHTFHLLASLPPKIGGGPDWVREQIEKQYPRLKKIYDHLN